MSVYALVDPRNGRCRYVGRSNDPSSRFRTHVERPHSEGLRAWIAELASMGMKPRMDVLANGSTEQDWMLLLQPDLNVRDGDPFDDAPEREVARASDGTLFQARMTADQKRLFSRAAEVQGINLSCLVRNLLLREVDRMRAEGKKL